MLRLARKFETAKTLVPKPIVEGKGREKVGIIAFGSSHWAVIESRDQLQRESKLTTDYLRVRAYPFTQEIHDFVAQHERIYVVEQNRDAQMLQFAEGRSGSDAGRKAAIAFGTSTDFPSTHARSPM